MVCNDSGPMHIAAAAGARVVAIYGSSTPDHTPPMTETRAIHYRRLSCSPCFERQCPLKSPAAHLDCLNGIHPDAILASLTLLADL